MTDKKTEYKGYHYWYDRSMKTWKAATFTDRGRQLTNALLAKSKTKIQEMIDDRQDYD